MDTPRRPLPPIPSRRRPFRARRSLLRLSRALRQVLREEPRGLAGDAAAVLEMERLRGDLDLALLAAGRPAREGLRPR